MAPHALTDLSDPSGYYPSIAHKVWSQNVGRTRSIKSTPIEPVPISRIPFANLGFGTSSPKNTWNLSSDEIAEIEKNVRHFIGTRESRLAASSIIVTLIRPRFTAQRHQSNNIPSDRRPGIKAESHIGKCVWRRAILHPFRLGSISIF